MSKTHVNKKSGSEEPNVHKILKSLGYTLGKMIGQGTYSKVTLMTDDTSGEKLACKIINKKYAGADFIKRFLPRELDIISKIQHPNIVNVFKIFEINCTIYMLMDYCRNGDLLEYIRCHGPLAEDQTRYYFRQVVSAVEYLHEMHVAHRDLKCENIFITWNDTIKLGDFGFARSCLDPKTGASVLSNTFCGSAAYAAPEILQGVAYDPKMFDIWALGCVLYIMLTASMPFDDTNIKKMIKSQLNRSLCMSAFTTWSEKSEALKNLLAYLLEPDVRKRATIKQVSGCLWLQETSPKKLKQLLVSVSDSNLLF